MLSKQDRFQLFLSRLEAATPVGDGSEALALIGRVLNEVEDQFSGIPADPNRWESDGRMYPPQADNARTSPDSPEITVYRSRSHKTLIRSNGAFRIIEIRSREIIFEKAGTLGEFEAP